METDALIETLEDAGLSPYQAAAYVGVLEYGTASATEIADASDVPAPRIYDVLDTLAERGYVETYEQDTLRARAHDPAEVLDDLRDRAGQLQSAADEIEDRWEQPRLESTKASIVKRFQTVIDRARMFIDGATDQIHLSVTIQDFERLRESLERAHERGVAVHLSIHDDLDEEPPPRETFDGACTEARFRGIPTPFVALIDRQKTCFAHHPDSFDQYGVLVNDQTHTFVFHWYFMTCLWENSTLIYSERNPEPPLAYVDIRQLIREFQPVLESDATVTVRVEGHDLASGGTRELTGTIVGTRYAGGPMGEETAPQVAGQVMLEVDTGEETVSVGGWGAVIEDIEATHILIEAVTGWDDPLPIPVHERLGADD